MGEVSLAYDDRLKRHVALKTLIAVKDDGREALLHEARAVAALSHPGIASIFDIIEDGDRAYIVMEYVEGDTLAARLRDGPLRANEATDIGVQICDALSAAHARHIIHRDLKPGNIMIGPGNRPKILDFGLARRDSTAAASAPTAAASSAVGGNLTGTVGYIAPEQMLGKPVDQRCDIYSLGAVLFEMFTGPAAIPRARWTRVCPGRDASTGAARAVGECVGERRHRDGARARPGDRSRRPLSGRGRGGARSAGRVDGRHHDHAASAAHHATKVVAHHRRDRGPDAHDRRRARIRTVAAAGDSRGDGRGPSGPRRSFRC